MWGHQAPGSIEIRKEKMRKEGIYTAGKKGKQEGRENLRKASTKRRLERTTMEKAGKAEVVGEEKNWGEKEKNQKLHELIFGLKMGGGGGPSRCQKKG